MSDDPGQPEPRTHRITVEPPNTGDPTWQKIEKIRLTRAAAMREAIETGKPYVDPYEEAIRAEAEGRRR